MPSPLDHLADWIDSLHGSPLGSVLALGADVLHGKDPIRLLRVALLTAFCWPALWSPAAWSAQVNQRLMIWFHEGGHGALMFMSGWEPIGRFLCIAAGSGAQIGLPLLFMVAVYSVGRRFDAALMFLWQGLNFIDVSRYAADAQDRAMPLVLGLGPEAHDWGNMLTMTHLLWATPLIAGAIWLMGLACFGAAVVTGFLTAQAD